MLFILLSIISLASCLPQSPNIVLLFADDLGYGDITPNGHPTIYTPNLIQLLNEGRRLSQWYSGWSMCTPSRAALLTGRIPLRSGMGAVLSYDAIGGIPSNETLLPELLKTKNYTTGHIGKWHLGQQPQYLPTEHGFDFWHGIPYSVDQGRQLDNPCKAGPNHTCYTYLPLFQNSTVIQQPVPLEEIEPGYAKQAVQFITENQHNPFFLYMAFSHAHVAWEGIQWCSPMFYNTSSRGMFGNAVQEMDWVLGQIMDTIRDLGLGGNTLVVFTSDNGPWLTQNQNGGSAGLFQNGKGSTWEGGIRMPAIAWWPGVIEAGSDSYELFSTMDLFTTFLSLAGVDVPKDRIIDGLNVTDALLGDGASPHEFMFFWNGLPGKYFLCAVRSGKYKVHYVTLSLFAFDPVFHNPPLLFEIDVDPSEKYPLDVNDYMDVLAEFEVAVKQHNSTMVFAVDQVGRGNDPSLAVCCDQATDCVCGQ